jgi:hypothetical protein
MKGWADKKDLAWMRDMEKEVMSDVQKQEDPRSIPMLCKCGHRLSQHYQGTQAMPCGKCNCSFCTAPNAEKIRRDRKRMGIQDITPHPDFRKGGRR